jgi:hypothetical protein
LKTIYFFKPIEASYVNPTTSIYFNIIQSFPNTIVVDIHNFNDTVFNPDSIIVYTPITLLGSNPTTYKNLMYRLKYIYNTPNLNHVNFKLLNKYYKYFLNCLENCFKNICILYELDLHDLIDSKIQIDYVSKYKSYMILGGSELYDIDMHTLEENVDVKIENVKKGLAYLKNNSNKVISLPHVISESEILDITTKINYKKNTLFAIPGTKYFYRKKALLILKKLNFSSFIKCNFDWIIMKILYKIPLSKIKHTLLHNHFTRQLTNSKFCFTCGSTAGYLVRKFFEIPSCGSIMITFNYKFLENCGFLPNVHYIPIDDISEFKYFIEKYDNLKIDQLTHKIRYNSNNLIRSKHSSFARYIQLMNTFEIISLGSFFGSYWEKGEYIILSND